MSGEIVHPTKYLGERIGRQVRATEGANPTIRIAVVTLKHEWKGPTRSHEVQVDVASEASSSGASSDERRICDQLARDIEELVRNFESNSALVVEGTFRGVDRNSDGSARSVFFLTRDPKSNLSRLLERWRYSPDQTNADVLASTIGEAMKSGFLLFLLVAIIAGIAGALGASWEWIAHRNLEWAAVVVGIVIFGLWRKIRGLEKQIEKLRKT